MPSTTLTKTTPTKTAGSTQALDTTRLLLVLWDLDATQAAVKKGGLMERVKRKGQKSEDYKEILAQLQADGAIAVAGKQVQEISLTAKGVEALGRGLADPEFAFESQIGAKTANALLKWLRQSEPVSVPATNGQANGQATNGKAANGKTADAIASYEEFQQVSLDVFDRLNRDYNMNNLVPIYRIRREIGDRVARSNFSEWMFKMQSEDIFQLLEECVEDSAPDKIQDSLQTKLGKFRCYAKRLAS